MTTGKPYEPAVPGSPDAAGGPTFRSAAVARMARMPVATLRIWEQRYQAIRPSTAASGHRLYSAADVHRVVLLRRLTEQGHAIGAIAALDTARLQEIADQAALAPQARAGAALRLVVVGVALAARLQRPAVLRHLGAGTRVAAVFESLAEAAQAPARAGRRADLLLWHAPELRPAPPPELQAALQACGAARAAVVYRFAGAAATQALAEAGVGLLREPADDAALGAWLASLGAEPGRSDEGEVNPSALVTAPGPLAPRRYDDATLTAIASRPPTMACECPRHVAELLMQLSSFEAYSAACISRDSADAQLHAHLQQVAGTARALFESALERVARHEGLALR